MLARRAVGPRRSSVFLTPVRAALEAGSQAVASERNARATGERVSAQAYALRRRILEVDAWRRTAPVRVCEVHPEVSFAMIAAGRFRSAR